MPLGNCSETASVNDLLCSILRAEMDQTHKNKNSFKLYSLTQLVTLYASNQKTPCHWFTNPTFPFKHPCTLGDLLLLRRPLLSYYPAAAPLPPPAAPPQWKQQPLKKKIRWSMTCAFNFTDPCLLRLFGIIILIWIRKSMNYAIPFASCMYMMTKMTRTNKNAMMINNNIMIMITMLLLLQQPEPRPQPQSRPSEQHPQHC